MQDQPRYEAYESNKFFDDGQASRALIEGTVPRGPQFRDANLYYYTGKSEGAQAASAAGGANPPAAAGGGGATATVQPASAATSGPDVFPFPITQEVLDRGQDRFNAYCTMCHGMTGNADGLVVRRGFRRPPSFHSEQLQEGQSSASHFFDVITNGWGAMPDYASMISAEDRWKIIAYVRALQLSQRARIEDVPAEERGKLGTGGQAPAPGGAAAQPHGGPQH